MNENNNRDDFSDNNTTNNKNEYEYKAPSPQQTPPQYTNQPNRAQQPQQTQTPTPQYTQPRQPVQPQQPPQQTQWTFNDYGPLGTSPQTPPKTVKPPKMAKPPKPPRAKKGNALSVISIALSLLCTASIASYMAYDIHSDNQIAEEFEQYKEDNKSNKNVANNTSSSNNSSNNATPNTDGKLSTQEVFEKAGPSVVGIVTYVKTNRFEEFGQGSGVILSENGYIVTNAHVVTDESMAIDKIDVVLDNGEYYDAQVVGVDKKTDIAVLKINAPHLTPAVLGDSDALVVGDTAIVIGNPDGVKYANTLTEGKISALNREVTTEIVSAPVKYIQTDAVINPGNSGGAMVNEYGEVVGIPVAKLVKTGFEGISFAIPINDAKPIIESIIENGYVTGRVLIGIEYTPIPESHSILQGIPVGLRVVTINEESDAFAKGVAAGDIITHMDGHEVGNAEQLAVIMDTKKPGEFIDLTLYRVDEQGVARTTVASVLLSEQKE